MWVDESIVFRRWRGRKVGKMESGKTWPRPGPPSFTSTLDSVSKVDSSCFLSFFWRTSSPLFKKKNNFWLVAIERVSKRLFLKIEHFISHGIVALLLWLTKYYFIILLPLVFCSVSLVVKQCFWKSDLEALAPICSSGCHRRVAATSCP